MSLLKTYDVTRTSLSIGGVKIVGFIDGEGFSVDPESDEFTDVVGTDGEVARSYTNDSRRAGVIRLLATSESNNYLNTLAATKRAAAIVWRDGSGTSLLDGVCYVQRRPSQAFGREVGTREWAIRIISRREVIGGTLPDPI